MQTLVISRDMNFAIVVASIVESLQGCQANWQPGWGMVFDGELDQPDLIIGCLASKDDVFSADRFLRNESAVGRKAAVLLIGEDVDAADKIKLIRLGAVDVLGQPINLQHIRFLIDSFAARHRFDPQHPAATAPPYAARKMLDKEISKLSKVDCNLLLTGETGVGKTYIAHQIHGYSQRGQLPFVTVNCAAIPNELIESELFGHKKGSYTGADANRIGKFEHAAKGTILLDEVDALPLESQATLLHAIEEREFHPVGSNTVVSLKARVISASNQDLETLIAEKRFRADLFYRLNVYELKVPSLRERQEEIEQFADQFAQEFAERNDRLRLRFSDEVLKIFHTYDWPGNLRELRNCIEYASIDCQEDVIEPENLPAKYRDLLPTAMDVGQEDRHVATLPFVGRALDAVGQGTDSDDWLRNKEEISEIIRVLCEQNYNRTKTAETLGISRTALYNKLSKYKLA